MALIDGWISDARDPIRNNLEAMPHPLREPRGFEAVGFDPGRIHSWLCCGVHEQAIAVGHNLHLTRVGLLATLEQAQAVAAIPNTDRDTANGTPLDVTWLLVLLTDCRP
jgi:hypothetical protein